jgi:hypothetical protein
MARLSADTMKKQVQESSTRDSAGKSSAFLVPEKQLTTIGDCPPAFA